MTTSAAPSPSRSACRWVAARRRAERNVAASTAGAGTTTPRLVSEKPSLPIVATKPEKRPPKRTTTPCSVCPSTLASWTKNATSAKPSAETSPTPATESDEMFTSPATASRCKMDTSEAAMLCGQSIWEQFCPAMRESAPACPAASPTLREETAKSLTASPSMVPIRTTRCPNCSPSKLPLIFQMPSVLFGPSVVWAGQDDLPATTVTCPAVPDEVFKEGRPQATSAIPSPDTSPTGSHAMCDTGSVGEKEKVVMATAPSPATGSASPCAPKRTTP